MLLVPLLAGQAAGQTPVEGGAKLAPSETSISAPAPASSSTSSRPARKPLRSRDAVPGDEPTQGSAPALDSTADSAAVSVPTQPLTGGGTSTLQAAQARVADLEGRVNELEAAREADQQRITALEAELAEERSRRERAAESSGARAQALSSATVGLEQADQALASGSSDVSGALAQAQALTGQVAREAGGGGSQQEALLAAEAQRWLALSQEALRRGDLFQARLAVGVATRAAQQARALAGSAGAGEAR